MKTKLDAMRMVLSISLTWGVIWGVVWAAVGVMIGIVDPDSIDPGESPLVIGLFLAMMGMLSGATFAIALLLFEQDKMILDIRLARVIMWAILGSTVVQAGFLGHGDVGIVENMKQALLFIAFGGVAAIVWFRFAKRWTIWRLYL